MIRVMHFDGSGPSVALEALSDAAVNRVLSDVAESARAKWINLAKHDSSHLRNDYLRAILPVKYKDNTATVTLVGETPHLLEEGAPTTDMRDFLLGPNVPVAPVGERGKHPNKKGGYYRAIPIRHTTPDSSGSQGYAMGSPYSGHSAVEDAAKLGKSIHAMAKKLAAKGEGQKGDRLDVSQMTEGLKKGIQGLPLLRSHHKSPIYQGMQRVQKTYEKSVQFQYRTFRTISTSVNDGSWIRGPIQARHYAKQVSTFANKILYRAIQNLLSGK